MPLVPYAGLHFEKFMYATEVLRPGQGDVVLRVHAVATDEGQGEISYAFGKGGWCVLVVCDSYSLFLLSFAYKTIVCVITAFVFPFTLFSFFFV